MRHRAFRGSKHLSRWGFTPQKPTRKACEQRQETVKLGSMNNTWRSRSAPRPKVAGFTGAADGVGECGRTRSRLRTSWQDAGHPYRRWVQHSKPIKAWAAERQDKIKLFRFSSYSPVLNPGERLNTGLEHAIRTEMPVRAKARLKLAATEHMVKLEKPPGRAKSFFEKARVNHATQNFRLHLSVSIGKAWQVHVLPQLPCVST